MSSQRDAGSSESWRASAAGALAGFLTRGVAAPLDVIKIRFQLQIEPVSHASGAKYRSLLHCIATILREESLSGLWCDTQTAAKWSCVAVCQCLMLTTVRC
eukprot:m.126621 g.126621  ORF g.126621 m.126621 type:complete len:101 (+) comp9710_c1_seq1:62-364(+)